MKKVQYRFNAAWLGDVEEISLQIIGNFSRNGDVSPVCLVAIGIGNFLSYLLFSRLNMAKKSTVYIYNIYIYILHMHGGFLKSGYPQSSSILIRFFHSKPCSGIALHFKNIPSSHGNHHNWLVVSTYPSEKYEFVSWEYDIPNIWNNRIHVPKHQPDNFALPFTVYDLLHHYSCWNNKPLEARHPQKCHDMTHFSQSNCFYLFMVVFTYQNPCP